MTIKHLLTKEQETFLKKHKISSELLFDAEGGDITEDLQKSMTEADKVIACNTANCSENDTHTLKTIGGFCPQCDTTKIAAALRELKPGYIYISGSRRGGLIKIGSSNEGKSKTLTLNLTTARDGGYDDWELLFSAKTTTLGRVERMFQDKLSEYKAAYQHEKSGKLQNGGELYRCAYLKAKEAYLSLQEEQQFEFTQISEKKHIISEYQFKNLKIKSITAVTEA